MTKLSVSVGSLRDMGDRLIDAWQRAQRGEDFEERKVTFFSGQEFNAALTTTRLELLRYVRREGAENVEAKCRPDRGH